MWRLDDLAEAELAGRLPAPISEEPTPVSSSKSPTNGQPSASPAFLPVIAIGAFAGLRAAEIERLECSDIDLVRGQIEVKKKKAKNRSRRLMPIYSGTQPRACFMRSIKTPGKLLSGLAIPPKS